MKLTDSPMEALGDVLRPSMLGPSSGSIKEQKKHFTQQNIIRLISDVIEVLSQA